MLELRTLGTVDLRADGHSVLSVLSQPTRMALLIYLAAARPRGPHRRDVLTHLLWPEREDTDARSALRQNLYRLRQSVGDEVVVGLGEQSVGLDPDALTCDAVEFEAALDEGRPEKAMELYRGPFLKGFHLPDSIEFERWTEREARRLARRAEKAAWALAESADERGTVREAESWARRAIELNPYEERGWRRLMALLDGHGERAGAVRAYEQLAGRLEAELGMEPSPETRAVAERIRSRDAITGGATEDAEEGSTEEEAAEEGPAEPAATAEEEAAERAEEHQRGDGDEPARAARPAQWPARKIGLWAGALGLIVAIAAVGMPWLSGGSGDPPAASTGEFDEDRTMAVLPFVDISPDPEQEYFSDGLTEEIIAALARLEDLRVVARTSAFAFRGEDRDIREIGRALNVGYLVEGSVRREGDRIRVAAQLIDAEDGLHLWSATYDREMTDVFEIQEELALRIAEALHGELSPDERRRLARRATEDIEAYHHFLRGRYFWNQRTDEGLARAVGYFERAIETDPAYARAYALLASVFAPAAELGYMSPAEGRERMGDAARRALELDDASAEAHTALGAYLHLYQWDWEGAERAYRRAIALDPDYATARLWYSYLLTALGRLEEAREQVTVGVALEPLTPIMSGQLGSTYRLAGGFDPAMEHYGDALELEPGFWLALESMGKIHEVRGELEEAVRWFERAVEHAGPTPRPKAGLARGLALAGRTDEARGLLTELRAHAAEADIYVPEVATVFEALGDRDAAFEWLERSYEQRNVRLQHIGVDSSFDRLRDDPRFRDLLDRIGLPETDDAA